MKAESEFMLKRIGSPALLTLLLNLLAVSALTTNGFAWSNGGYSSGPEGPFPYGTHDWIAELALDWLPTTEKQYILDNFAAYMYGTELPDNSQVPDGIGDTAFHHVYWSSSWYVTDDAAAIRANEEFNNTLHMLKLRDYKNAAKHAGMMSHYIADLAVFGHVMGSKTEWGEEIHHEDYERYVNEHTSVYDSDFNTFLMFDGSLIELSAYDATLFLSYDTTFDPNGSLTAVWMDHNYNWDNPTFWNRAGESLNLAVNYIADVLHTLYIYGKPEVSPPSSDTPTPSPLVTIPLWTLGAAIGTVVLIAILVIARARPKQPRGKMVR